GRHRRPRAARVLPSHDPRRRRAPRIARVRGGGAADLPRVGVRGANGPRRRSRLAGSLVGADAGPLFGAADPGWALLHHRTAVAGSPSDRRALDAQYLSRGGDPDSWTRDPRFETSPIPQSRTTVDSASGTRLALRRDMGGLLDRLRVGTKLA